VVCDGQHIEQTDEIILGDCKPSNASHLNGTAFMVAQRAAGVD
jgi:hypothetical protein